MAVCQTRRARAARRRARRVASADNDLTLDEWEALLEAYLDLAATHENEGLFDDEVWVAEVDGRVAGFIAGSVGPDGGEITWIYVDPSLYRRGIGRTLVEHFVARSGGPVELEVLDGNAARAFYESLGFVLESTTTGKLAGNEAFTATGHTLVWSPPVS